jgi:hypothetical protein
MKKFIQSMILCSAMGTVAFTAGFYGSAAFGHPGHGSVRVGVTSPENMPNTYQLKQVTNLVEVLGRNDNRRWTDIDPCIAFIAYPEDGAAHDIWHMFCQ